MGDAFDTMAAAGNAAARDAAEILRRIEADEAEAEAARVRFQMEGLPRAKADESVVGWLLASEDLIDVRHAVVVTRHASSGGSTSFAGALYLTTRRLLLLGRELLSNELTEIEELVVAGERLLLTLTDGVGLSIDASRPRLLRVQIAAAVASARA
jgi:hypothetical protein